MKTNIFKQWLVIAVIVTCFYLVSYALIQQTIRLTANEPQVAMAEDIAASLSKGQFPKDLNTNGQIDISKSLSTFIIIFDSNGKAVSANGKINGQIPVPPKGVFDFTLVNGEDRFTWETRDGTRIAAAVVKSSGWQNGFVLVGRSLREVEKLENKFFLSPSSVGP